MARLFSWCALLAPALAAVPTWPSTYQLNRSTINMMCNYTGQQAPATTAGWATVDFDWSNNLAQWSASVPMDTEERLMQQAALTVAATPDTRVWIYRNSVYGYPWYTAVRAILDDPAYEPWFIQFKPQGPWTSPKCDDFHTPPLCTEYFHTQMDTPRPDGKGYGQCAKPACNCGTKPCGFYVFNHSTDAVVKGQTFQQWFLDSYVFDAAGLSPLVSGYFFDDFWSPSGNMGDNTVNATQDMGLTPADLLQLTASYTATMAAVRQRALAEGKFSWQMLWTGGGTGDDDRGSTCPGPLVRADAAGCRADLARLCAADAPQQSRAMMYSFSPGGCRGNPASLPSAETDIANFLLIRGDYSFIGHGWLGCSHTYEYPPLLNADFGACARGARAAPLAGHLLLPSHGLPPFSTPQAPSSRAAPPSPIGMQASRRASAQRLPLAAACFGGSGAAPLWKWTAPRSSRALSLSKGAIA